MNQIKAHIAKPRCHSLFQFVSIFLSLTLSLCDSLALAQNMRQEPRATSQEKSSHEPRTTNQEKEAIPTEYGTIDESYLAPSTKCQDPSNQMVHGSWRLAPVVYYIQDAHDSLEAQENIAKLIHHFVKKHGVKTVFEEGYEGVFPADEYFGFIKEPKLKEKVAYFFMDKLRLGGAEYAHINKPYPFKLIGADRLSLYHKNIEAYRKAFKSQKKIEKNIDEILIEIGNLAKQKFPKEFSETQRELFHFYRDLSLLKRLNRMEITSDEYIHLKSRLKSLNTDALADFLAKTSREAVALSKLWEIKIKNAFQFYEAAHARESAIEERLDEFLKSGEKTAVLVYGGFHKNSIRSILQQKGLSYQIITPRITEISLKHQDYYKQLMSVGYHKFEAPFLAANRAVPAERLLLTPNARAEIRAVYNAMKSLGDYNGAVPDLDSMILRFSSRSGLDSEERSEAREPEGVQKQKDKAGELLQGLKRDAMEIRHLMSEPSPLKRPSSIPWKIKERISSALELLIEANLVRPDSKTVEIKSLTPGDLFLFSRWERNSEKAFESMDYYLVYIGKEKGKIFFLNEKGEWMNPPLNAAQVENKETMKRLIPRENQASSSGKKQTEGSRRSLLVAMIMGLGTATVFFLGNQKNIFYTDNIQNQQKKWLGQINSLIQKMSENAAYTPELKKALEKIRALPKVFEMPNDDRSNPLRFTTEALHIHPQLMEDFQGRESYVQNLLIEAAKRMAKSGMENGPRSEMRAEVARSIREKSIMALIWPSTIMFKPQSSQYQKVSRELNFEASIRELTPEQIKEDKAKQMIDAALAYWELESKDSPQTARRLSKFKTHTTVLAVELPTLFYFPTTDPDIASALQISFRRSGILIPYKYLESHDPKDPMDQEAIFESLDLAQAAIDKHEKLFESFDHEELDLGVTSVLDRIQSELDAFLETQSIQRQIRLRFKASSNKFNIRNRDLSVLDQELRLREKISTPSREEQVSQEMDTINSLLKGSHEPAGYTAREMLKITEQIALLRPEISKEHRSFQQGALFVLREITFDLLRLAFYYEFEGRQDAEPYYKNAIQMYKASQKIDFAGFLPLKIQEELFYLLVRRGDVISAEEEWDRLVKVEYVPWRPRRYEKEIHKSSFPTWIAHTGQDILYKLQSLTQGATPERLEQIHRLQQKIQRVYWRARASMPEAEKKFSIHLPHYPFTELKQSPLLLRVSPSKHPHKKDTAAVPEEEVFAFSWITSRIKDEIYVRVEAIKLLGDDEIRTRPPIGYLDFTLYREVSTGVWKADALTRTHYHALASEGDKGDAPLFVSNHVLTKYRNIPWVLLLLANRLAFASGARFKIRLEKELQDAYGIKLTDSQGRPSEILPLKGNRQRQAAQQPLIIRRRSEMREKGAVVLMDGESLKRFSKSQLEEILFIGQNHRSEIRFGIYHAAPSPLLKLIRKKTDAVDDAGDAFSLIRKYFPRSEANFYHLSLLDSEVGIDELKKQFEKLGIKSNRLEFLANRADGGSGAIALELKNRESEFFARSKGRKYIRDREVSRQFGKFFDQRIAFSQSA